MMVSSRPAGKATVGIIATFGALTTAACWSQGPELQELRGPRPFALRCLVQGPEQWPDGVEARLLLNYQNNSYYCVRLTGAAIELQKIRQGAPQQLAEPRPILPSAMHALQLRRGLGRLLIVCDGQIVLDAYDSELAGGQVGWSTTTGQVRVAEFTVTHFEPLYFVDSFERHEGMSGNWQVLEGSFGNVGLTTTRLQPELSANPFSFGSRGFERNLAVNGNWHWSNYRFSAAVKANGAGAVGLAFHVQDKDNYYLMRWVAFDENAEQGCQRQLIRVRNGRWALLESHPGGFSPDRWYRLSVTVIGGHVEGFIDEERVFQRYIGEFGMGQIGLYYSGGVGAAYFDDVMVMGVDRFSDDFESQSTTRWAASEGQWNVRGGILYGRPAGQAAVIVSGEPTWRDVECTVRTRLAPGIASGIVVRDSAAGRYVFQVQAGPAGQGEARWLRIHGGNATVLDSAAVPIPDPTAHLSVAANGPYLEGRLNDRVVSQCVDGAFGEGCVGLMAAGAGEVAFDNFTAQENGPPEPPPPITEQFTKEATMTGWASPAGRWTRHNRDGRTVRWYAGAFYGDAAMSVVLPKPQEDSGQLWVALCGDGDNLDSGYVAHVDDRDKQNCTIAIRRAGTQVTEARVPIQADEEHVFRFARRRGLVYGCLDDRPVVSFKDVAPLSGRRVGLATQDLVIDLDTVIPDGENVLDYTFSRAPYDWYPARGVWEVADRWACYPGWAWFCGKGHESPLIWSKRVFRGDLTLEWYTALAMLTDDETGYPHPSDINCTICGDGKRLDSGYSFIFNGWNNTKTAILKGGTIVAQTDKGRFEKPVRTNLDFQRHWFYVRLEKHGPTLRLSVDGEELLQWTDPQPLQGGHIAFWTYKNGLMNARTRISYQAGGEMKRLVPAAEQPDDLPFSIY